MKSQAISVYRSLPGSPAEDLAFEEQMLKMAAEGKSSLFIYSWKTPTLVLGIAQKPETVALESCATLGIPVIKRLTGGTGVLSQNDLAVTLALPDSHPYAKTIAGLYEHFLRPIKAALNDLGVDVQKPVFEAPAGEKSASATTKRSPLCFEDIRNETFLLDGKKCVGCAQARRKGAVLIHGSLLLDLKAELTAKCFGMPQSRIEKALAGIPLLPQVLAPALEQAMLQYFS